VSRPKHPRKDLEAVLRAAEGKGWRVIKGKGYYRMLCPCGRGTRKSVHLTPSDPDYRRHLLGQPRRATCWDEEKPR
jgi:hypothetical protein